MAIAVVLATVITLGLLIFYPYAEAVFPLAVTLPLLLSTFVFRLTNKIYRKKAHAMLVETLTFSSGFAFAPKGFASMRDLPAHAIWPPADSTYAEDSFDGSYNNVALAVQDVVLNQAGQSKKGIVARVILKKPVDGHTVVISANAVRRYFQNRFDNYGKVGAPGVFDKQVEIFSNERAEARLLVDTAFLTRLTEAAQALKAGWFAASFQKSSIVFFIERNGRLADPGPLWQPVGDKQLLAIYEQFEAFFKLADTLRANKQIYT